MTIKKLLVGPTCLSSAENEQEEDVELVRRDEDHGHGGDVLEIVRSSSSDWLAGVDLVNFLVVGQSHSDSYIY